MVVQDQLREKLKGKYLQKLLFLFKIEEMF